MPATYPDDYIADMHDKLLAAESSLDAAVANNEAYLSAHPSNAHSLALKPLLADLSAKLKGDLHMAMDGALTAYDSHNSTSFALQYGGHSK